LWRAGEFVQVQDLVLHDAGMDARSPTHELVRAHSVLLARRRIEDHQPNWALTTPGLRRLRGQWSAKAVGESGSVQTNYADRDDDDLLQFQHGDDASMEVGEFTEIDVLLARTSKVEKNSPSIESRWPRRRTPEHSCNHALGTGPPSR
jgi:hypothetical protein